MMKAWLLNNCSDINTNTLSLSYGEIPRPVPTENEILIKITCCAICHTELDEIECRTAPPYFPVVPGHQVVGRVENGHNSTKRFKDGTRVGVGWIFWTCGKCEFCKSGYENLCPDFKGTGRDVNGGYAEYMIAD